MDAVQLIRSGLESVKGGLDRTLEGLTPAELKWQPRSDANSIGLILFHVARSQDSMVRGMLQGKPQLWESEKWYQKLNKAVEDRGGHYTAEQVASFVVPDIKDLRAYWDALYKDTLEYLKTVTPENTDKKISLPPMGPPPAPPQGASTGTAAPPPRRPPFEPTVGAMLLMNVTHAAQHAGEISYLRGLQRGMDK